MLGSLSCEFGPISLERSRGIGNDVDEDVDRPAVAQGTSVVGFADPMVETEGGLELKVVAVCLFVQVGSLGRCEFLKFASFLTLGPETEFNSGMASEDSSLGLERASATKLAFPCT